MLRAISADAALLRRLRGPRRRARVHSVFARVINLEVDDGRLLTLAHRDSDDAPDTVVAGVDTWALPGVAPGLDAALSAEAIDLGSRARIALDGARPWRGRLPELARETTTMRANLPIAFERLQRRGKGLGIAGPGREAAGGIDAILASRFRALVEQLLRALANDDSPRAIAHADCLLGLGTGLTPSGDDVLLGLLAALNTDRDARRRLRALRAHVARRAGERTHPVSAAALRHAADGRVRASVADLCGALMHEAPRGALHALDRVLRIGSGSGSEIAFGVLAGFRIHLERSRQRDERPAHHRTVGAAHG